MAWRIHEHILRGELDNRTRGRVTGRLWLAGVDGDCAPDIAGRTLTFENPAPLPLPCAPPSREQRGVAGEITAARKVRVFDVPVAEAFATLAVGGQPPERLAAALHIEWFNPRAGGFEFVTASRLTVSEAAWRYTAEEAAEYARRLAAEDTPLHRAWRADDSSGVEWDEFRNEQLLRESDVLNERHMRLWERYGDHPQHEQIIAYEMGWDSHAEAIAAARESAAAPDESAPAFDADAVPANDTALPADWTDHDEPPPDSHREGLDWVRREDGQITHPIAARARAFLDALEADLADEGTPLSSADDRCAEAIAQAMTLYVKLSAHLAFIARGDRHTDAGLLIAWLKRDLTLHGQTLAALADLTDHPKLPAARLAHHRADLFALREALLTVLAQLRDASD
jgi:hypothetical protein